MKELFIRRKEVPKLFGVGYSSISYLQRTDENFPKPIKVSEAITVWSVEELKNYFLSKPRITNAEG